MILLLTHGIRAGIAVDCLDGRFFSVMLLLLFALSSQNNFQRSPGKECSGGIFFY
jgi:hypothetical protein